MDHRDHVDLLRDGIPQRGGTWADFGSGSGAFTLALADLIGPSGTIYSVEKEAGTLHQQERVMRARFPQVTAHYLNSDFTGRIELPALDGLVMANSLHFVRDKEPVLALIVRYLKPGGRFILVEYNVDQGNTWVPYPLSYATWEAQSVRHGLIRTRRLAGVPSRFLREIYSAVSEKP